MKPGGCSSPAQGPAEGAAGRPRPAVAAARNGKASEETSWGDGTPRGTNGEGSPPSLPQLALMEAGGAEWSVGDAARCGCGERKRKLEGQSWGSNTSHRVSRDLLLPWHLMMIRAPNNND